MIKNFWSKSKFKPAARITENVHVQVPNLATGKISTSLLIPREMFNEETYLDKNADVAAAVQRGETTAYEHYVRYGFYEENDGRRIRSLPRQSQGINVSSFRDDDILARLINVEIEKRALLKAWDKQAQNVSPITFEMLSEDVDDELIPPLDKIECDETNLTSDQVFWRKNGFLVLENFLPEDLIEKYCRLRERHPAPGGWSCPVPYMHIPEIRDLSLYPPLMDKMEELIGEEVGLHLNLTGWVTTTRNWHQDDYLNPYFVNSWYSAVWMALDDIHPDCGPFEFVPGSHRWRLMKSRQVRMYLTPEERDQEGWPTLAERFVNDIAAAEIERQQIPVKKFLGKKGDVLIWHGRLMHRGSYANVENMQRKSLISHYSGLSHRVDMPNVLRTQQGKAYFSHNRALDWDPYK